MKSIEYIGENIRILRLKNGFSQEQLALSAGVNTSYIGQIERGEKNPTIKILEQISAALEITLIDLLSLYDPKGGVRGGCHPSALTITPETIKQCLLEVLMDNTNILLKTRKYYWRWALAYMIENGIAGVRLLKLNFENHPMSALITNEQLYDQFGTFDHPDFTMKKSGGMFALYLNP